jgi:hypothetical protein
MCGVVKQHFLMTLSILCVLYYLVPTASAGVVIAEHTICAGVGCAARILMRGQTQQAVLTCVLVLFVYI